MKCKICGHKTNCDCSIGRDSFIVCNKCAQEIVKRTSPYCKYVNVLDVVLAIGFMKEEFLSNKNSI